MDDTNSYDQRPKLTQHRGASHGTSDDRDYLGYSKSQEPFEQREERWEDEDNMFDGL